MGLRQVEKVFSSFFAKFLAYLMTFLYPIHFYGWSWRKLQHYTYEIDYIWYSVFGQTYWPISDFFFAICSVLLRTTMCDFHDFGLTLKCQKMWFGWLHGYLKRFWKKIMTPWALLRLNFFLIMLILAFEANRALSHENETKIVKITHSADLLPSNKKIVMVYAVSVKYQFSKDVADLSSKYFFLKSIFIKKKNYFVCCNILSSYVFSLTYSLMWKKLHLTSMGNTDKGPTSFLGWCDDLLQC